MPPPSPSQPPNTGSLFTVPPQPLPALNTGSLFRKARRGEEKSALVSGGVAGQECPRQGTCPSPKLRPARQTEGKRGVEQSPSQLAWETSRGASTGPRREPEKRVGRPGGHQGVSC